MNAVLSFAGNGYGSGVVRTARDTEYDVFSRVTRMLRQAENAGHGPELIAAIHKNNQLWTILATDLADSANALPDELKARLLSLAGFSLRHGHLAMAAKVTVVALVEINMAMMRGLRQEVLG